MAGLHPTILENLDAGGYGFGWNPSSDVPWKEYITTYQEAEQILRQFLLLELDNQLEDVAYRFDGTAQMAISGTIEAARFAISLVNQTIFNDRFDTPSDTTPNALVNQSVENSQHVAYSTALQRLKEEGVIDILSEVDAEILLELDAGDYGRKFAKQEDSFYCYKISNAKTQTAPVTTNPLLLADEFRIGNYVGSENPTIRNPASNPEFHQALVLAVTEIIQSPMHSHNP